MKLHRYKFKKKYIERSCFPILLISSVDIYTDRVTSWLVSGKQFARVCKDIREFYDTDGYSDDDIVSSLLQLNSLYSNDITGIRTHLEGYELMRYANRSTYTFDFGVDRLVSTRDYFNCLIGVL